jgi:hypothetical protein
LGGSSPKDRGRLLAGILHRKGMVDLAKDTQRTFFLIPRRPRKTSYEEEHVVGFEEEYKTNSEKNKT